MKGKILCRKGCFIRHQKQYYIPIVDSSELIDLTDLKTRRNNQRRYWRFIELCPQSIFAGYRYGTKMHCGSDACAQLAHYSGVAAVADTVANVFFITAATNSRNTLIIVETGNLWPIMCREILPAFPRDQSSELKEWR